MEYEIVDSSTLPTYVQQGLKKSPDHKDFSTYQEDDQTYIVYHLNEPSSYSSLNFQAKKRFSQPIITATITHAVNDPLVDREKAIKLKMPSEKELKFQVVDER